MSNSTRGLPLRLQDLQNERDALHLRLEGLSYEQIGDAQGCTAGTASNRVQRAIRDQVPAELREDARRIQHERITAMVRWNLTVIWSQGTSDDAKFKAQAMLHRWLEREAKLLGLDMPVQIEIGPRGDDLDQEIEALMAQLTRPIPPVPAGHRPPPPMPGANGNGAPTNGQTNGHHPP